MLLATGETLAQVQNRVLGAGVNARRSSPRSRATSLFGVRGGCRFGAGHEILVDLENLGDKNYRGISWGVDAPGRNVAIRYVGRF